MIDPKEFDQYSLGRMSDEFKDWGYRLCGALCVYAVTRLFSVQVGNFASLFRSLLEYGSYEESAGGWLQPLQADYMRTQLDLIALSMSPERNIDGDIESNIHNMQTSKRLPSDSSRPEVKLFRETFGNMHSMHDVFNWFRSEQAWVMIASVREGYGGLDARHQITIYNQDGTLYVIDSAGNETGKGITYELDKECESYLTGHCILVTTKSEN